MPLAESAHLVIALMAMGLGALVMGRWLGGAYQEAYGRSALGGSVDGVLPVAMITRSAWTLVGPSSPSTTTANPPSSESRQPQPPRVRCRR